MWRNWGTRYTKHHICTEIELDKKNIAKPWNFKYVIRRDLADIIRLADPVYIITNVLPVVSNTFWRDVLQGWSNFLAKHYEKVECSSEILCQSVWWNDNIKIGGKPVYYLELFERGIIFINDFMYDDRLYNFDEFQEKYDMTIDFLKYQGLRLSINKFIKKHNPKRLQCPFLPYNCLKLGKEQGSKYFYQSLFNTSLSKSSGQGKWEKEFDKEYTESEQEGIYLMSKRCTQSVNLKWFQFKLVHNILFTNTNLHKTGYVDSPMCTLCEAEPETVIHLLSECEHSKRIWSHLSAWLNTVAAGRICFTNEKIILGFEGKHNNPLNVISIIPKQNIYNCSKKEIKPCFKHVKKEILNYYEATKINYFQNCQFSNFFSFWSSFHTLFADMTNLP
ncbi:uncharacterized protein LOC124281137 [Haliotis rubra]|uniref:uncharacterized protein LOC124281137 n=1 Tax=Haliotis rubra TaxID=36100 RepID=UPI001EE54F12|nr:uncharacterized protein LOC124281137 [Haliotis rubra]